MLHDMAKWVAETCAWTYPPSSPYLLADTEKLAVANRGTGIRLQVIPMPSIASTVSLRPHGCQALEYPSKYFDQAMA
jgi:hypothetical protein